MPLASKKSLAAGVLIGALAATLTFTIDRLVFIAPYTVLRWLQAAAFTLIVPGVIVDFFAGGQFHGLPLWLAAACNFFFWLGFAWLFGLLLCKLRQQLRLLATYL